MDRQKDVSDVSGDSAAEKDQQYNLRRGDFGMTVLLKGPIKNDGQIGHASIHQRNNVGVHKPSSVSYNAIVRPINTENNRSTSYVEVGSNAVTPYPITEETSRQVIRNHRRNDDDDDYGQRAIRFALPWELKKTDGVSYLQHGKLLTLDGSTLPLSSKIYPSGLSFDSPNGLHRHSTTSHGGSGNSRDNQMEAMRSTNLSQHDDTFDNLKHINNFFMADETRLPVYIVAFGSGFFSVLICLCAILYTRYLFGKIRRVRSTKGKYEGGISPLPLLDKQAIEESYKQENLAEIRAKNPSLARIENYIRGEIKKWEQRVRAAEEKAKAPSDFQQVMSELASDVSNKEDGAVTVTDVNTNLDSIFMPMRALDENHRTDSGDDEEEEQESEDEYSESEGEELSSEYTDSEYSSDSGSDD
ncbi:uncharacterized protein BXIN_1399 [Babesia sp. Xinjiang]|uniref:uncharacterized protein n=1 Tax=Babesia sp. Xinjiang TaxID=462227 RepID=UPI000A24232A|nr:uncharacterized protein BXIN_1399 [Babesia sp. Xinjiang]ORM39970.1 hypothetical protein BXIN_1399 [Babesia sp. Xinjiang]